MLACGDIGVSEPGEISAYRRLGGYRRTGAWGDIGVSAPAWGGYRRIGAWGDIGVSAPGGDIGVSAPGEISAYRPLGGDIGVSAPGGISAYRRLGRYRRTGAWGGYRRIGAWGDIGVSAPGGDIGVSAPGGISADRRLGRYRRIGAWGEISAYRRLGGYRRIGAWGDIGVPAPGGDIGVSAPGEISAYRRLGGISAYRRLGGYRRIGAWGDIGVSAPGGDIGVSAPGGDIGVSAPAGDIGVSAPGGDIGVSAPGEISAPGGDIGLSTPQNDIGVSAPGGAIGVSAPGEISAPGGDIGVSAPGEISAPGGDIGVSAPGGDIGVSAPGGISAYRRGPKKTRHATTQSKWIQNKINKNNRCQPCFFAWLFFNVVFYCNNNNNLCFLKTAFSDEEEVLTSRLIGKNLPRDVIAWHKKTRSFVAFLHLFTVFKFVQMNCPDWNMVINARNFWRSMENWRPWFLWIREHVLSSKLLGQTVAYVLTEEISLVHSMLCKVDFSSHLGKPEAEPATIAKSAVFLGYPYKFNCQAALYSTKRDLEDAQRQGLEIEAVKKQRLWNDAKEAATSGARHGRRLGLPERNISLASLAVLTRAISPLAGNPHVRHLVRAQPEQTQQKSNP